MINKRQHYIELLYDAVTEPDLWPEIVKMLVSDLNSDHGIFALEKLDHSAILAYTDVGFDEKDMEAYSNYFVTKDHWLPRMDQLGHNTFHSSVDVYDQKAHLASEMYNDWGKALGIEYASGAYLSGNV